MVLKKSKIKIPYIRLNFQIVRQSDARWCERSKIPHQEEFSPTRLLLYDEHHNICRSFISYLFSCAKVIYLRNLFSNKAILQVYEGIILSDNISQLTHVFGGAIGAIMGYILNKE